MKNIHAEEKKRSYEENQYYPSQQVKQITPPFRGISMVNVNAGCPSLREPPLR